MNTSTKHILQCNQSEPLADASGRIVDLMYENACGQSGDYIRSGVPQESIISLTSFTIKINSMIDALSEGIEKSLYVDDLAVYCQSSTMAITERRLQDFLDKLVTCADENGFKFSPTRTLCVHFGNKNGLQPESSLKRNGQQLHIVHIHWCFL